MLPELDKYGPYVFTAYAIAIVVLAGVIGWTIWRAQHAAKRLEAAEKGDNP